MEATFPPTSKLLNAPLLSDIESWLEELPLSRIINSSHQSRSFVRQSKLRAETALRDWLKPSLSLEQFPYASPSEGISQGILSWLFYETRPLYYINGDYKWLSILRPNAIGIDHLDELPQGALLYLSNPSAIDGNFVENWDQIADLPNPIVLDCAYLGTTRPQSIPLSSNIERVFYSFSKGFGLQYLRMGWVFSKNLLKTEETLLDVSYHSLLNTELTYAITQSFGPHLMFERFFGQQAKICEQFQLQASDCVLLGLSKSQELSAFQRSSRSLARVPISDYFF